MNKSPRSGFRVRVDCEDASVERGRPVRRLLKLPMNTKDCLTSVLLVWMSKASWLAAWGRALQDSVGEVNENPHLLLQNLGLVLPFWATLLSSVIWHQPS